MSIPSNNLSLVPYLSAIESSVSSSTFNKTVEAVAHLPSVIEALAWCHSFFIDGAMKALKLKDAHLFALCGSKEVVNQALANGVDFSSQDIGGRTPAFYAALRVSSEIYDEIMGAKPTKKQDIYGGSAAAIWQLIHPNTTLTCAEGTCMQGNTQLEEHCLPKGASLLSTATAKAETLLKLWKKEQPGALNQIEALVQPTKSAIQRLKNSPPKLAVKAVTADDRGNPLSAGCGLFADRAIKKGELIGEYGGLLTLTPPTNHEYELNYRIHNGEYNLYFDADAMRTPVSMANDGYPNAHLVVVANADGLPIRHYLEALSPIEPGEQIVWDYTYNHDIKVTHKELRLSALDRAIRGKRYSELVAFKPTREGIQEMIRTFTYLFHTPSSVIRLLAEGALQFEPYAKAVLNHPIRSNLVSVELHLDTLYLVNELLTKVRAMDSALFPSFAGLFIEHKGGATDSESKHAAYLIALHNAARKANKLLREGEELSAVHEQIRSSLEEDQQTYTSLKHCNDYFIQLQRGEGLAFPQLRAPKK